MQTFQAEANRPTQAGKVGWRSNCCVGVAHPRQSPQSPVARHAPGLQRSTLSMLFAGGLKQANIVLPRMRPLACVVSRDESDGRIRPTAPYFLRGGSSSRGARCLAQRAWAALLNVSLRTSGLTLRQRAAPSPTACRLMGEGESFRLAMSSISNARSISTSGGRPLCRMMRRSVKLRRTPRHAASSDGIRACITDRFFAVDMRLLAMLKGRWFERHQQEAFPCPAAPTSSRFDE